MSPPLIFQMKPADLLLYPLGGEVFGIIPAITAMGLNLAQGKVYLKAGEHYQPASGRSATGHGLLHIWHGKKHILRKRGIKRPEEGVAFVASLIRQGTEIYHDVSHRSAAKKRKTLLRTIDGTLTLEPRHGDRVLGFHYSVVTWTPRMTPRGTKVGEVIVDWAKEKATGEGAPLKGAEVVVAAIL